MAIGADGVALAEDGERLARYRTAELTGPALLLGLDGAGTPLFAVDVDGAPAPRARTVGLRDAGGLLDQREGALAAYATALVNWHRRHPRCAVCGAATEPADAGHARRCPSCGTVHHPRTDPVVIMLVTDGDRALLGRQPSWPDGRYSALAGFVEPGETLEEAVLREVREESRVEARDPRYVSSQPWPFPAQLMLGFRALLASGEPRPGDGELADVRWFTRDELREAAAGRGPVQLPGPVAIARRLVDAWLAEDGVPSAP